MENHSGSEPGDASSAQGGRRQRVASSGRVVECRSWRCLNAIHWPAVDGVIRPRLRRIGTLVDFMTGLAVDALPRFTLDVDATIARRAIATAVAERLTQAGAERRWLIDDIARLTTLFLMLAPAERARIRLEVIDDDACRYFHVDHVRLRLVTTYRGPGTQWLPETAVDRSALDRRDHETICRSPEAIRVLAPGTVGLFKGARHPEGGGLVHRSPPLSGTGIVRLFLAIDPIDDLGGWR